VAKSKKLFDEPNERKLHKTIIPTLGGLGIFAGFMFATLLFISPTEMKELQYFFAAALVIFFLGLKDDILVLSVTKKFIGQIIAACILILLGKIQIQHLHGLFGIEELPASFSFILTLLLIIFVTTSLNLIDGVDGLTGSLGILTSLAFGSYFFIVQEFQYAILSFALTGSLIGFLVYNFPPAKIFMGDTGSMLVGLTNSILLIKFLTVSPGEHHSFYLSAAPAIGFALLSIPVFDSLRVFTIRILHKRSPFSPDRNHIHHFLLDIGCPPAYVSVIIVGTTIFWTALAVLLHQMNPTILLAILLCGQLLFSGMIFYIRKNKMRKGEAPKTSLNKKVYQKPLPNWVMDSVE
jgi:UDP-N-acetylmuramyl pentapeptide phosphotransferase/UDP-N-acetylglucosamine-1-phosphate transferase